MNNYYIQNIDMWYNWWITDITENWNNNQIHSKTMIITMILLIVTKWWITEMIYKFFERKVSILTL